MKIQAGSPARAAWAAVALARLPVEAQAMVSSPSATAALMALATTRSLKESVGWETLSFLSHTRATPSSRASAGDSTSGVRPVSSENRGAPVKRKELAVAPERGITAGDGGPVGELAVAG